MKRAIAMGWLLAVVFSTAVFAQAEPANGGAATATFARIVISGNTAVPSSALDAIAVDYVGRAINDDDLQALRRRIDEIYAGAGFRTSRASIPNQDIGGGVLRIDVLEGGIERIDIEGARHVSADYLRARIQAGLGAPLDVDRLNDNLRLLLLEQLVENLKAEFKAGSKPGLQVLTVRVEEGPRYSAGLRAADDRSPTAGGVRGAVETGVRNLFGRGDELNLSVGQAAGLRDFDVRLRAPLNTWGTEISARYARFRSELVEEEFAVLDAETHARAAELGLTQALWRSGARQFATSLRFTSRQSTSFLRGEPHSFSPGAEHGKLDVKAARFGVSWLERGRADVLSLRYTWSLGLPGLGGTEHHDGVPDSRFHASLVQAQWLHTFGPRLGSLALRGDWQDAAEPLLSMEKFAIGGTGSVRGYRRSRLVKDNGWSASVEYRLPVLRLALPGVSLRDNDGQLSLVAFIDAGRAWNEHDGADDPRTLLAAGPGLRWDASREVRAELYWGAARRHFNAGEDDDIQDQGIHFALSARRGF
ncbi:MAG: ShlB/FhaC/HecB family hemolysin secretion/activation protein [Proteobacteria bacterium]|nr:ShlB/FhaC/HecB family hemolysin secretion/activation protein [Pseudomonadota bacterium]